MCLGYIFADLRIYLTIAISLAAFDIHRAVRNDNREEDDIQPRLLPGITSRPVRFEMRGTARSKL
jgi:hypothetical protein